ncbi:tyrosine-type recombinase/integrase [Wukongibacter sp. M2B1]|uniref:tyrosine-type recombinase/integrase n=1 Tax=Wukongibacter sp. M2B1 TaxID=3088895 RepID=UPI003D7947FE
MALEQINIFQYQEEQNNLGTKTSNVSNIDNQKIFKRYKMHCISKGLTDESLKAIIGNDLRLFIQYIKDIPLNKVSHFIIQDFLLHCQEDRKNGDEALSRKFTSLNTFFNTLIKQEVLGMKNPLDKLEKPKIRKKERNFLTYEEYQQILNYLDNSKDRNRVRDAALIAFFFSSGCRLTEVHQQNKQNLDYNNRRFKVLGKGAKERICIFSKEAATRLRRYLMTRSDNLEALFVSRQKNRLSKKAIQDAVKEIGKRANVSKNVHPHIFRHSRAMYLLEQGANLETIQRLLGHSSISTTQIYAHMNMTQVQDEIAAIDGDI